MQAGAHVHRVSDAVRQRFPESSGAFDDFERHVDEWQVRFNRARSMAKYEERRLVEEGVRTARRQIGHLFASTAIRVVDLASGMVLLINENHAHAAFAAARSLVETASVPAYVAKNVAPRLQKGRAAAVDDALRRLTVGVDPGIGLRRPTTGALPETSPIRVSKLVDALCSELDRHADEIGFTPTTSSGDEREPPSVIMRQTYSLLSDHAHPNHSAVHLSAALDEDGMDWLRGDPIDEGELVVILGPTALAMYGGGRAFDEVMRVANKHPLELPLRAPTNGEQDLSASS